MTPQHNRTLSPYGAALLIASLLSALPASAASYQFRQFVPGLTTPAASPVPPAQDPVAALTVALSGASLPAAMVTQPYSYNLNQLLAVTGDANYDSSGVAWSVPAGSLPPGLSLGADGVILGTPTEKNEAGSSFQILATYKTKTGQQAYTIVVSGVTLQVTQIDAGADHTCAVTTAGGVKCWGYNAYGQLGDGTKTTQYKPVSVTGLAAGVRKVSAGYGHTCAVTTAGAALCWGYSNAGQLGDGYKINRTTPVAVTGGAAGVADIAAGDYHTCISTSAGGAQCWGDNSYGQLGDKSSTLRTTAVPVANLQTVVRIAAGANHTCAILAEGSTWCWGYNGYGQLGTGGGTSSVPVAVAGLPASVADIALSTTHTCAALSSGAVYCWGANTTGQLGDGTKTAHAMPAPVSGLSNAVGVAVGTYFSCAATQTGAVCWGDNSYGQLGNGSGTAQTTPVAVSGLSGVTGITAGAYHVCAVVAGGGRCWGYNYYGTLGDNTRTHRATPIEVSP